jgi:hypothetical protein
VYLTDHPDGLKYAFPDGSVMKVNPLLQENDVYKWFNESLYANDTVGVYKVPEKGRVNRFFSAPIIENISYNHFVGNSGGKYANATIVLLVNGTMTGKLRLEVFKNITTERGSNTRRYVNMLP